MHARTSFLRCETVLDDINLFSAIQPVKRHNKNAYLLNNDNIVVIKVRIYSLCIIDSMHIIEMIDITNFITVGRFTASGKTAQFINDERKKKELSKNDPKIGSVQIKPSVKSFLIEE